MDIVDLLKPHIEELTLEFFDKYKDTHRDYTICVFTEDDVEEIYNTFLDKIHIPVLKDIVESKIKSLCDHECNECTYLE